MFDYANGLFALTLGNALVFLVLGWFAFRGLKENSQAGSRPWWVKTGQASLLLGTALTFIFNHIHFYRFFVTVEGWESGEMVLKSGIIWSLFCLGLVLTVRSLPKIEVQKPTGWSFLALGWAIFFIAWFEEAATGLVFLLCSISYVYDRVTGISFLGVESFFWVFFALSL